MRTIDPEQPVLLDDHTGIIVGSITGLTALHYWEIGAVPYANTDGTASGWLESASRMTNAFGLNRSMIPGKPGPDPGLDDVLGRVFAVALPAGSYALFPAGMLRNDPVITIQPAEFTVEAGRIRYLGRIQLQGCLYRPADTKVYRGYINAFWPAIHDLWEQDKPIVLNKYPGLAGLPIQSAVLDDSAWASLADELEAKLETDCAPE